METDIPEAHMNTEPFPCLPLRMPSIKAKTKNPLKNECQLKMSEPLCASLPGPSTVLPSSSGPHEAEYISMWFGFRLSARASTSSVTLISWLSNGWAIKYWTKWRHTGPVQHTDASNAWIESYADSTIFCAKYRNDIKIIFLGDSITKGWDGNGRYIWKKHYAPRGAFNYGIGGDRTEQLIWRIQNGEFDFVMAKVVVLLIGKN